MHQADDRYFVERGYGHRQGLMANQQLRRNPTTRNNNYMVGSMPRQDYSAKQQLESENDEMRNQMQFVARRGTNPRPKGLPDGGAYRNIDNFLKDDQQDQM